MPDYQAGFRIHNNLFQETVVLPFITNKVSIFYKQFTITSFHAMKVPAKAKASRSMICEMKQRNLVQQA